MSRSTTKRVRWGIGVLLVLACLTAVFWPSRPERILLLAPLSQGEADGRRLREQLAACGPEAIAPTLKTIERHHPWYRWPRQLPLVLGDIGDPARRALLQRIDAQQHTLACTRLIAALQIGFSDYSRLELWLTNAAVGGSAWYAAQFAEQTRYRFPDAPDMRDSRSESGFNPEFVRWWHTNATAIP